MQENALTCRREVPTAFQGADPSAALQRPGLRRQSGVFNKKYGYIHCETGASSYYFNSILQLGQALQRRVQRIVLLRKTKAHDALVKTIAIKRRQRNGGDTDLAG